MLVKLGLRKGENTDDKTTKGEDGHADLEDSEVGETINFTANGESHKVWIVVKGSNVDVMVASIPKTVDERLNKWSEELGKDEVAKDKKGKAGQLLADARTLLNQTENLGTKAKKELDEAVKRNTPEENSQASDADDKTEASEKALVNVLKQLFEIFGGDDVKDIFGAIALYRGLHYDTGWNDDEYQRTGEVDMTGQETYSLAASELGGSKHPYDAHDVDPKVMQEAVAKVKAELAKFNIPEGSDPIVKWWKINDLDYKDQVFDSKILGFIQHYVNDYGNFKGQLGGEVYDRKKDKWKPKNRKEYDEFSFKKLPIISTSKNPVIAVNFALGQTAGGNKRQTGLLGKAFVYLFNLKELAAQGAIDIDQLNKDEKIDVRLNYREQEEVALAGGVPGENLVGETNINEGDKRKNKVEELKGVAKSKASQYGGLKQNWK